MQIAYSDFDRTITVAGLREPLWQVELRDLARGFTGGLFVALPLLYTEEMWDIALSIPPWALALFLIGAYLASVGYALFSGFREEMGRQQPWFDAAIALFLGFAAALITLLMFGRYSVGSSLVNIVDVAALEAIPTSFGASIAIHQLGARQQTDVTRRADFLPEDVSKVLATVLGALLFSFNIAPTNEPLLIATTIGWWHVIAIAAFSLTVSFVMISFARFALREGAAGVLGEAWVETAFSYLVALAVSAALLWFFGYLSTATSFPLAVKWTLVLGYVTTLGGSAGRLVL